MKLDRGKNKKNQKNENGEDLKYIDFHQLQIENKKLDKELKSKVENLVDLKVKVEELY